MNPWISIVATYGIQFAFELAKIIESKGDPTSEDFLSLIQKYGTETLVDKAAKYRSAHPELGLK